MRMLLSEQIIEARKSRAANLGEILQKTKFLEEQLHAVATCRTRLDNPPMLALDEAARQVGEFAANVRRIYERYERGVITVAIAGLEKAGKTTFLKSLTGIEGLPTAAERCTAVSCEILFAPGRNDCDLEFYSEKEFFETVVAPMTDFINEQLDASRRSERIPHVDSLAGFSALRLPPLDVFSNGTDGWINLAQLLLLQRNQAELHSLLSHQAQTGVDMCELREWTAHPDIARGDPAKAARLACIKRCRLHTEFPGGSKNLRWIDTPGIDDPNPRAVETTLKVIGEEADLLVVASKPAANPSPTKSFTNFWTQVDRLPTEIALPDKLLIALNWHKGADPDGAILEKHREILKTVHGVPAAIIRGPFEANKPTDAVRLMEQVNVHLANHLAGQDDETVRRLTDSFRTLLAGVRRDVYDRLRREYPVDRGQEGLMVSMFNKFFKSPKPDGSDSGFFHTLKMSFADAAFSFGQSDAVNASQARMLERFKKEYQDAKERWPNTQRVDEWKRASDGVVERGMGVISSDLTLLANALCGEMVAFGPVLQAWLVDRLSQAGLNELMPGDTPAARLAAIAETAMDCVPGGRLATLFAEAANLSENLQYMFRYELRPAINFSEFLCWNQDAGMLFRELRSLYKACDTGVPQAMREFELLPSNAPTDRLVEMFKETATNSLAAIQTVLTAGRCRLSRIADDFARDSQIRLCSGGMVEEEWRTFLYSNMDAVLGRQAREVRLKSESVIAFRDALRKLGEALS